MLKLVLVKPLRDAHKIAQIGSWHFHRLSSSSSTTTRIQEPAAFTEQTKRRQAGSGNGQEKTTPYGWLMLSIPLATFCLGCWQVQRKSWKEGLIRELELQTNKSPVPFPKNDIEQLDDMEYQSIHVEGEFLHDRELIMGPRSLIDKHSSTTKGGLITRQDNAIGYLVITPFRVEGTDHIILINRGWVPRNFTNSHTRNEGNLKGSTELVGVVRTTENRPQFSPKNSGDQFLYRDIPQMCARTGAAPYWLDANAESTVAGGPIGGQTRVTLRNDHLSYLVTWYSLSAITAYLWYRQIYKRIPR